MRERGIIMTGESVRAILAGTKTQTRRVLKPQPERPAMCAGTWLDLAVEEFRGGMDGEMPIVRFDVGDRLWVREAWGHDAPDLDTCRRGVESDGMSYGPYYWADGSAFDKATVRKLSPIHMPRWASRLTLAVTDVRVQRLQDISEEDAVAEGLACLSKDDGRTWKYGIADRDGWPGTDDDGWPWEDWYLDPRIAYARLWNSIHGPTAWDANPWVAAITFEPVDRAASEGGR